MSQPPPVAVGTEKAKKRNRAARGCAGPAIQRRAVAGRLSRPTEEFYVGAVALLRVRGSLLEIFSSIARRVSGESPFSSAALSPSGSENGFRQVRHRSRGPRLIVTQARNLWPWQCGQSPWARTSIAA
jgi:hypothetical protein